MNPRDQFIKEFVLAGKASGATQQEVESKLATALVDFDKKYPIKAKLEGKFAGWIPDVAQTVGNIAATPFGKPARVAVGGITRAAGESIRQAIDPTTSSIGPAFEIIKGLTQGKSINDQILTPEQQSAQEYKLSKQAAKENLGELGKEAAVGVGSTAIGEYILSPLLDKATAKISSGYNWLKKKGLDQFATTFKDNQTAQKLIQRSGGPEKLAQEMIDNNIPMTKTGVQKELTKLNSQYEKEITNKLKTIGQTRNVNVDQVIDDLIEEGKKIYDLPTPTAQRELADFTKYIESFRGQYTGPKGNLANINVLRKKLDQAFAGVNPSNIVDGEKLANDFFANRLRSEIQSKAPLTKSFFKKYSLLKKAEQIFYKEPKVGITEYVGAAVGNLPGFIGSRIVKSPGVYRAASSAIAGKSAPSGISALDQMLKQPSRGIEILKAPRTYINPSVAALQRAIDNEGKSKQSVKRLP